jgi:hypothetical protein
VDGVVVVSVVVVVVEGAVGVAGDSFIFGDAWLDLHALSVNLNPSCGSLRYRLCSHSI